MTRHATIFFTAALMACSFCRDVQAVVLEDLNYGFATYLGSGIYKAGDQSVQVYQIPLSYQFFEPDEKKNWGLKLTLPVTLGFYDFSLLDITEGFPDELSTLSIVPGVVFQYQVTKRWQLSPFVDYGVAKNMTNGDASRVYSYGLRSDYVYVTENVTYTLDNRLLYAKQKGVDRSAVSDFGAFETSLDFRFKSFPFFKKHLADISVYIANFRYFDDLEFLFPPARPVRVLDQNEVGITFGVQIKNKTKYIDIPRVGLAVRKGDGLDDYRIGFGAPF